MTYAEQDVSGDPQVEYALRSVLGSRELSPEQRARLRRLAYDAAHNRQRLFRERVHASQKVSAAYFVIILCVAALALITFNHLSGGKTGDVKAAERLLAAPTPGYGRHVVIDVRQEGSNAEVRAWRSEIWQRTLTDGTQQLRVQSSSQDESIMADLLLTGSEWVMRDGDTMERGSGQPRSVPPEATNVLVMPETLRLALAGIPPADINEREQIDLSIISATLPVDHLPDRPALEAEIGGPVASAHIDVTIDRHSDRIVTWRETVVDTSGREHLLREMTFVTWESLSASEISEAHFSIEVEMLGAHQSSSLNLPEAITTPQGQLELSSTTDISNDLHRVIYTGPNQLVVQIDLGPDGSGTPDLGISNPQRLEVDEIMVIWRPDPTYGWPRTASWATNSHRLTLSVIGASTTGWSEEDLIAVVMAIGTE